MSVWTEAELLEQIASTKDTIKAVTGMKSVTRGDNTFTYQDLPELRKQLKWLERELQALQGAGGPRTVAAVVRHT